MPFVFDATPDAVSIYEVSAADTSNDDPHIAPLNHLSRVKLHSDFVYPKVSEEQTFSITLPARGEGLQGSSKYVLGSHSRGFVPLILASTELAGAAVALPGTVPVQTLEISAFLRTIAIGADASNIFLYERYATASHDRLNAPFRYNCRDMDYSVNPAVEYSPRTFNFELPALTLAIKVILLDINVEVQPTSSSDVDQVEITPTAVRVPNAGFDTDARYLRNVSTGRFAIPAGGTFVCDFSNIAWGHSFGDRFAPYYVNGACRWSFKLGSVEIAPTYAFEHLYQGANHACRFHPPTNIATSFEISA